MDVWVEQELDGCAFPDQRLKARLGKLLGDLGRRIGGTVPAACQDWAATTAAHRFFDNPRVDEGVILAGHFAATTARFAATAGTDLVLHDTTEFSFTRDTPDGVGQLSLVKGRHVTHTVCGLLMHSSLVVTTAGLPLGLAAVKFWTRKKFKGTNALKRTVNPTRVPIEQKQSIRWLDNLKRATTQLAEPARCVHVGDREADIFELFCAAHEARTHFLVRTCVDRLAGQGKTTVATQMAREPIRGSHDVEVRDDRGRVSTARVYLRFSRVTVQPPIGKQKRYPALSLTVIHAHERGAPEGRDPIRWEADRGGGRGVRPRVGLRRPASRYRGPPDRARPGDRGGRVPADVRPPGAAGADPPAGARVDPGRDRCRPARPGSGRTGRPGPVRPPGRPGEAEPTAQQPGTRSGCSPAAGRSTSTGCSRRTPPAGCR
jgi:hypothetical protein